MKLNHLFAFHGFFALLYGLSAVIAPVWLFNLLAFEQPTSVGVHAAQYMGALLLGAAVLAWLARSSQDLASRRTMAASLMVYSVVAAAVSWIAQLSGSWRPLEWATVALLTIWALGYIYFLFIKPEHALVESESMERQPPSSAVHA